MLHNIDWSAYFNSAIPRLSMQQNIALIADVQENTRRWNCVAVMCCVQQVANVDNICIAIYTAWYYVAYILRDSVVTVY